MNTQVYIDHINVVLQMCWETKDNISSTQSNKNKQNTNTTNLLNVNKTPFAMKSFQTMYNQFLYKQSLRKKIPEKKKNDVHIVKSFEDLDKLTKITNDEDND